MVKSSVSWLLLLLFFCLLPSAQTRTGSGFPKPPDPADRPSSTANQLPPVLRIHIDPVQLQREAKELSDLAQSLPADIDKVNHGLLPKDTLAKLKRIEKLSKHLRGELAPW